MENKCLFLNHFCLERTDITFTHPFCRRNKAVFISMSRANNIILGWTAAFQITLHYGKEGGFFKIARQVTDSRKSEGTKSNIKQKDGHNKRTEMARVWVKEEIRKRWQYNRRIIRIILDSDNHDVGSLTTWSRNQACEAGGL